MNYRDKNLNYINAEAYDKRGESSVLENYVLGLWQPFLKKIIRNLSIDKTVIDWGCGTCEYARAADLAKKIYAIDVSEEMLKSCREKLINFKNVEIVHGSGFNKEIADGAADLILTIGVWEYVNPRLLFNEVKRLSRKGSKVIVVFPNIYNNLHWARSMFKLKMVALRPGFIKKIFANDFILLDQASFGMVTWVPGFLHSLFLPIWRFNECLWRPFQKSLPLGINVYYLFERR